jgi:1-deoxy-D-xylulose-5-phosphate reductoisomerase
MNKGLEVIEAHWLFGLPLAQIDVVVHPQSIIHSFVQITDGSLKAQLGLPDMRLPIQYALGYPQRGANSFPRADFLQMGPLTFEAPNRAVFRTLDLAYHALAQGGNLPCALNAANEVAVAAFLREELSFVGIFDVLSEAVQASPFVASPTLEALIETDHETRLQTAQRIGAGVFA